MKNYVGKGLPLNGKFKIKSSKEIIKWIKQDQKKVIKTLSDQSYEK